MSRLTSKTPITSDEEDKLIELRSYRNLLAPTHLLSARMNHHPSPKPEHATSTLDRRNGKPKQDSTGQYGGTLPRHTQSTYAKLRTVATFTNMYFTHKEAAEEELNFLRAVEREDINEVRSILEDYESDVDSSESSSDERPEDKLKDKQQNGKKQALRPIRKDSSQQTSPSKTTIRPKSDKPDSEIVIEIDDADKTQNESPASDHKPVAASKWAVAKRKRHSKVHLPVITTTRATPSGKGHHHKLRSVTGTGAETRKFNKNCRDEWGRSALFIAMLQRDEGMIRLLLSYKLEIDECLYHAVDFGFYDVVELFMEHDLNRKQVITGEDSFYPAGLTPIQLAAHKNDYVMLKILYTHGFRISSQGTMKRMFSRRDKSVNDQHETCVTTVLEKTWDASNNKILYYRALASPAYMIMMLTEAKDGDPDLNPDGRDFLENIFQLYRKLKKKANTEPTARSLYVPLAEQVEDFACDLLSEVRSPSDLADLLRFDPPGQPRKTLQKNYLAPMQRGFEVRMKRFVAHDNCQLTLSCIRQGTLFESENGWRTGLLRGVMGLMFPILCLAFIVAPDSRVGKLLRNPMVNLSCHVASEVFFLLLIDVRIIAMTFAQEDCLGVRPGWIEWMIMTWIIARFVDEIKKFRETPIKENFTNQWRLNDVGTLGLFILIIVIKIAEIAIHSAPNASSTQKAICNRSMWEERDIALVSLSESCLAFVTILIHIRALELLYIDRTFGPLQLSLDKMILDTIRFLLLFVITFFGFALAMTQLYWAYGTPRTVRLARHYNTSIADFPSSLCEGQMNNGSASTCYPVYSTFSGSILEQYWTLYGYGWGQEPPNAVKLSPLENGRANLTEYVGSCISIIFHLWAVVIMLNMLIAMMSHSFDRVRDNAEVEWKYHRSGMWMKFIRKGIYPRPPPMNLIPSPRDLKSGYNFLKRNLPKCCCRGSDLPNRSNAQRPTSNDNTPENYKYRQAISRITNRYLRRYLLPDFKHDDSEQLAGNNNNRSTSQQSRRGRKPSYSNSEISSN